MIMYKQIVNPSVVVQEKSRNIVKKNIMIFILSTSLSDTDKN